MSLPTEIAALIYGAVVGLSLGLTGGGGSIFAVPLLVYGLGLGMRSAVALSLLVVGLTAIYGAALQCRGGTVRWRAGLVLGLGGLMTAPLGSWLGRLLPEALALLLFALLMLLVGWRMWSQPTQATEVPLAPSRLACRVPTAGTVDRFQPACAAKLLFAGAVTGVLAGMFGVGGGFLVVPALLIVARLPIVQALATSLVGIGLISIVGFAANAGQLAANDRLVGMWFLIGAGAGMTIGIAVKRFLPGRYLSRGFALMVIAVAGWMLWQTAAGWWQQG